MIVLLIIAAVLFLIGCIPVGVLFRYHEQIELKLTVLFLKIGILPKKPLSRKKREKAEAKKAKKAAQKAEAKEEKRKKQQRTSALPGRSSASPCPSWSRPSGSRRKGWRSTRTSQPKRPIWRRSSTSVSGWAAWCC